MLTRNNGINEHKIRLRALISRNIREILRDKLSLVFGVVFPIAVFLLLTVIRYNIPEGAAPDTFLPENLAPGTAAFGLSFLALFTGMLFAKDRTQALIGRIRTAPVTAYELLLSYILPMIPVGTAIVLLSYAVAWPFGLPYPVGILCATVAALPGMVFYIAFGLLFGSLFSEKAVGSICGAGLANIAAWLSGAWFDLALFGDVPAQIARFLPFSPLVECGRAAIALDFAFSSFWLPLLIETGYAALTLFIAVCVARRKLRDASR